ncbi:MAG TPA: DUF3299 domain-containing protein [Candidatus Acidoferrum sp.]|nr:DUF3299 domain-containing protein [Candidatus Acidoferrum sp.]
MLAAWLFRDRVSSRVPEGGTLANQARTPAAGRLTNPERPALIRGEPIIPNALTNSAGTATSEPPPQRKKRPKPASFQHRMVAFQVRQAGGTNSAQTPGFGGTPAKLIYTPERLAALPEPDLPPGYQRVGFDTLSAFPFVVTAGMADGSNNLAAASAATRAKIPPAVLALDNRLVAIRGFLLPLKMNEGLAFEFLLMRNQNMCCFGSVPTVNEWISVETKDAGVKPLMDQPITVLGKLRVGDLRENGYLVGIYKLEAERVYEPR